MENKAKTNRILAKLSKFKKYEKRLTVTTWGESRPQLDLRYWDISTDPATPGKGMVLTRHEARLLAESINAYLAEGESR